MAETFPITHTNHNHFSASETSFCFLEEEMAVKAPLQKGHSQKRKPCKTPYPLMYIYGQKVKSDIHFSHCISNIPSLLFLKSE